MKAMVIKMTKKTKKILQLVLFGVILILLAALMLLQKKQQLRTRLILLSGEASFFEDGSCEQEESVEEARQIESIPAEKENQEGEKAKESSSFITAESGPMIHIHISGAVVCPDQVIILPEGSRIADVVELAGGWLPEASLLQINLAQIVEDGQKIYIPFAGEEITETVTGGSAGGSASLEKNKKSSGNDLKNLNEASKMELQELPGIGPALAERIIAYRQQNGPFSSVSQLMEVSGIGEKIYDQVKNQITVE